MAWLMLIPALLSMARPATFCVAATEELTPYPILALFNCSVSRKSARTAAPPFDSARTLYSFPATFTKTSRPTRTEKTLSMSASMMSSPLM